MGLLDTYESIQKEAEVQEVESERRDILTKYASAAEELLEKEYGKEYEATDVENLAEKLIDIDIEEAGNQQKTAEYVEAGQVMARAFVKEIQEKKSSE